MYCTVLSLLMKMYSRIFTVGSRGSVKDLLMLAGDLLSPYQSKTLDKVLERSPELKYFYSLKEKAREISEASIDDQYAADFSIRSGDNYQIEFADIPEIELLDSYLEGAKDLIDAFVSLRMAAEDEFEMSQDQIDRIFQPDYSIDIDEFIRKIVRNYGASIDVIRGRVLYDYFPDVLPFEDGLENSIIGVDSELI